MTASPATVALHQPTEDLSAPLLAAGRRQPLLAPAVVRDIAARAATEVDGVVGPPAAVRVDTRPGTEVVTVALTLQVAYPAPVSAVADRVRDHVSERLRDLCGLRATRVDILVADLVLPGAG